MTRRRPLGSHDLSGWVKALWFIFILVFPLIGVLVYLIARGARCTSARRGTCRFRSGSSA